MEVHMNMELYLQILPAHNFSEIYPKLDPIVWVREGNIVTAFHSQAWCLQNQTQSRALNKLGRNSNISEPQGHIQNDNFCEEPNLYNNPYQIALQWGINKYMNISAHFPAHSKHTKITITINTTKHRTTVTA